MKMSSTFFSSSLSICSPSRSFSINSRIASLAFRFISTYTSSAAAAVVVRLMVPRQGFTVKVACQLLTSLHQSLLPTQPSSCRVRAWVLGSDGCHGGGSVRAICAYSPALGSFLSYKIWRWRHGHHMRPPCLSHTRRHRCFTARALKPAVWPTSEAEQAHILQRVEGMPTDVVPADGSSRCWHLLSLHMQPLCCGRRQCQLNAPWHSAWRSGCRLMQDCCKNTVLAH